MNFQSLRRNPSATLPFLRTSAFLLGLLLLGGCREPMQDSYGLTHYPLRKVQPIDDIRPLDPEIWSRIAISYSGFREGQSPNRGIHPSRDEILEDLRLLEREGFGLIRVFSSGLHGRTVVELIDEHGLDIKVQVGAYVDGAHTANAANNMRELDDAIDLANRYPDIVVSISVGNEVLVFWSFVPVPPQDMVNYIRYVRERIAQPVTVNDNWEPFAAEAGTNVAKVWGQIDFAAIHTYAYWDAGFNFWDFRQREIPAAERARAMMDAAFEYARKNFADARSALNSAGYNIPIVIGETGWQSVPSAFLHEAEVQDFAHHQAHPINQLWYFEDMMRWAYGESRSEPGDGFSRPAAMFYFAAFDEPWKEADDNWGLWDANRRPKLVIERGHYRKSDAAYFREETE